MNFNYIVIIIVLFISCCAHPVFTAENTQYEGRVISEMHLLGLEQLSLRDLLSNVELHSRINTLLRLETLQKDANELYLTGYFSEVKTQLVPTKNFIEARFILKENPIIKKIEIQSNHIFSDDQIRGRMKNKAGHILNIKKLKEDLITIQNAYQERGYDFFEIMSAKIVSQNRLIIEVSEGEVEKIKLSGLKKISPHIVRRELTNKEGHIFNSYSMAKDQDSLLKLGYFSQVKQPEILRSEYGDKIHLLYDFTERKNNLLNVGLEQEDEKLVAFIKGVVNHVGIESAYLRGKVQIGQEDQKTIPKSYSLGYYQPWFMNLIPLQVGAEVWTQLKAELSQSSIFAKREGWLMSVKYPLIKHLLTVSTKYKNELVKPETVYDPFYLHAISGGLSYFSEGYIQNKESGHKAIIYYERGFNISGNAYSGLSYHRYTARMAQFISLPNQQVLGLNASFGYYKALSAQSAHDLTQFKLGGSNSLRGFPEGGIQGVKTVLFNGEYRWPLSKDVQAVLFLDAGNAFLVDEVVSIGALKVGKGVGLRFKTPLGPIRTDFSWGDAFVVHINIGQIF